LGGGFFAGRATADDDQIDRVARGHESPHRILVHDAAALFLENCRRRGPSLRKFLAKVCWKMPFAVRFDE
jgi:hypothetical protein